MPIMLPDIIKVVDIISADAHGINVVTQHQFGLSVDAAIDNFNSTMSNTEIAKWHMQVNIDNKLICLKCAHI